MIDTVRLTLSSDKFQVLKPELFTPNANILEQRLGRQSHIKCMLNPSKSDIELQCYRPKLTLIKRLIKGGTQRTLSVEFSAPKLIFNGSNFDEVEERDFQKVIQTLGIKLKEMAVIISLEDLKTATVSAVHFSKNVPFLDYTTVSSVLKYLEKIDLTRRLDLNKTHFRNGGSAVYFYSKSFAFVLYDKLQDLKQPKGRGVEDNTFHQQMDIFDEIRMVRKEPLEVIRLEFRLLNRRKISQMLKEIGEASKLNFQELFSKDISRKMLLKYWGIILDALKPVIISEDFNPQELTRLMLQKYPKIRLQTALSLIGVFYGIKEIGVRPLKMMLGAYFHERTCSRLLSQINSFEFPQSSRFEPFNHISKVLSEFKPLKMKDFTLPF